MDDEVDPAGVTIADLSARTEEARQRWLELAAIAREHYAKGASTEEIAPALAAVDQAERVSLPNTPSALV